MSKGDFLVFHGIRKEPKEIGKGNVGRKFLIIVVHGFVLYVVEGCQVSEKSWFELRGKIKEFYRKI